MCVIISVLAVMSLMILSTVEAAETFFAGYTDTDAPFVVDGDLGDWDEPDFIVAQEKNEKYSASGKYAGTEDLTVEFSSFGDKSYLYFAVRVADDAMVFGEAPVGTPIHDDCVEVRLYEQVADDTPMKIWVSAWKAGGVRLEGREFGKGVSYPDLWQDKGVKAEIVIEDDVYTVEVAVPVELIHSLGYESTERVNANMLVCDDDDGDDVDTIIQWNADTDIAFNTISYSNFVAFPEIEDDTLSESSENTREVEVVLAAPDINAEVPDYDVQLGVARAFEKAKLYDQAVSELEKVIAESSTPEIKVRAKSDLARNLFIINDFTRAKSLCRELLDMELAPEVELNAKMVLLSIERKENPKPPFHK